MKGSLLASELICCIAERPHPKARQQQGKKRKKKKVRSEFR
jgi:hypothetical protein